MSDCAQLVTAYIDRVVNRRDITAVEQLVSPSYTGSGPGWPTTYEALRRFYLDQYRDRPDWHLDVVSTVELGQHVTVLANAGGNVLFDGEWRPRYLTLLAHYRVTEGRIRSIDILEVVQQQQTPTVIPVSVVGATL
jgi:predicted SnoaL-like aldol condensation-catalyzing enzyme